MQPDSKPSQNNVKDDVGFSCKKAKEMNEINMWPYTNRAIWFNSERLVKDSNCVGITELNSGGFNF